MSALFCRQSLHRFAVVVVTAVVLPGGLALVAGCATTAGDTRFEVRSDPPGAVISGVGGEYGVTPLTLDARRIYPNDYPDAKAELYGKLVFSRPGCAPLAHRVSMSELKHGVDVRLDCAGGDSTTAAAPAAVRVAAPAVPADAKSATLSERRLRQLRVLNELLEDGLISPEEERSIRQRIFERLDGSAR